MGVLRHKIAPMGVRESLVTNAERFTSYRQMKDAIEEWIANGGENQFAAPMDVDRLGRHRHRATHPAKAAIAAAGGGKAAREAGGELHRAAMAGAALAGL